MHPIFHIASPTGQDHFEFEFCPPTCCGQPTAICKWNKHNSVFHSQATTENTKLYKTQERCLFNPVDTSFQFDSADYFCYFAMTTVANYCLSMLSEWFCTDPTIMMFISSFPALLTKMWYIRMTYKDGQKPCWSQYTQHLLLLLLAQRRRKTDWFDMGCSQQIHSVC